MPMQSPATHDRHNHGHEEDLVKEIAALEARLERLARSDDSAYEKALIRSYEQLIATRRAALALRATAL